MVKTIEEINKIAPYHPCEWQQGYGIWQAGYMEGQKDGSTEQRAIDIDKACEWLKARNVLTDASLEGFRKSMEE